jgi:hypothetical protein
MARCARAGTRCRSADAGRGARTRIATALVVLAIVSGARDLARADDSAASAGAASARREFNIFPVVGGDSDVGIGFGQVSDWARLASGDPPFKWRLESGAFITFKFRQGIVIPFQDYYVVLTIPNVGPGNRWRLDVRPAFTDETTLKYYGLGNASPLPVPARAAVETEYSRMHPTLLIRGRTALAPSLYLQIGTVYTHNLISVRPNTVLAEQRATGPQEVRELLRGFDRHGVGLLELGVEYDSRDNEIVTRHGMFHALQARISPRVDGWLRYPYVQLNSTARFYVTPIPRWLTIAWRVVGDVILGTPPFYELARFDETPAIGGGKAVRGVPAQRYYGAAKVFENLEVTSELFRFQARKKQFALGAALFLDAGRSWTELTRAHPDLDGTGLGIKYGVGGGLRLQQGETFVVRADIAWSPDARPVGGYFAAGEIF